MNLLGEKQEEMDSKAGSGGGDEGRSGCDSPDRRSERSVDIDKKSAGLSEYSRGWEADNDKVSEPPSPRGRASLYSVNSEAGQASSSKKTSYGRFSVFSSARLLRATLTSNRRLSTASTSSSGSHSSSGTIMDKKKSQIMDLKEKMRSSMQKDKYNVMDFYRSKGIWQVIARSALWDRIVLVVITLNVCWIAADTNHNEADLLLHAHWLFQFMENGFCTFFTFEWLVRFMAFRRIKDGWSDGWFISDGIVLAMMITEVWLLSILVLVVTQGQGGIQGSFLLRAASMLRVARMCRMTRLLRCLPELLIMIKGLMAAARSVFFTVVLLCMLLFVFGIFFTQMSTDTSLKKAYFGGIFDSMYFLLVHGTLLLNADYKAQEIAEQGGPMLTAIFFIYILFGAVLIMNMLIGVLCEVVAVVSATEQEEMLVEYTRQKLQEVMNLIDEDGSGLISRDEFSLILSQPKAMEALQDVGVDVMGLLDIADFIFGTSDDSMDRMDSMACEIGGGENISGESQSGVELSFAEFMDVVLQLRGSNNATVKDMVDLRKYLKNSFSSTGSIIDAAEQKLTVLVNQMSTLAKEMEYDSKKRARRASAEALR
eukprot:TRINITY_DN26706_c0_g1_i4.p1 TRINITY_DN26706_c0_g1~~TRINITY_DN26706_c0_g1_i4.p1  ORF type:complete len:596 (-),score=169.08 TRINITY_DN26706_c0_g1_i4:320-2107(-)